MLQQAQGLVSVFEVAVQRAPKAGLCHVGASGGGGGGRGGRKHASSPASGSALAGGGGPETEATAAAATAAAGGGGPETEAAAVTAAAAAAAAGGGEGAGMELQYSLLLHGTCPIDSVPLALAATTPASPPDTDHAVAGTCVCV